MTVFFSTILCLWADFFACNNSRMDRLHGSSRIDHSYKSSMRRCSPISSHRDESMDDSHQSAMIFQRKFSFCLVFWAAHTRCTLCTTAKKCCTKENKNINKKTKDYELLQQNKSTSFT